MDLRRLIALEEVVDSEDIILLDGNLYQVFTRHQDTLGHILSREDYSQINPDILNIEIGRFEKIKEFLKLTNIWTISNVYDELKKFFILIENKREHLRKVNNANGKKNRKRERRPEQYELGRKTFNNLHRTVTRACKTAKQNEIEAQIDFDPVKYNLLTKIFDVVIDQAREKDPKKDSEWSKISDTDKKLVATQFYLSLCLDLSSALLTADKHPPMLATETLRVINSSDIEDVENISEFRRALDEVRIYRQYPKRDGYHFSLDFNSTD